MPCKNFFESGDCKFGEGCSFFHAEDEKRKLIDPLPNLPEGVTLPPMPEKLKNYRMKQGTGGQYYKDQEQNMSPHGNGHYFTPAQQPMPMFQISSLTDIVALGGFNPNKYLTPQPMQMQFPGNAYGQIPPHMLHQQMPHYGSPAPFGGQMPAQKR
jgi:hypothetical protein